MKLMMIEGKPVRDAKRRVVLQIKFNDIKSGVGHAPDKCAAAVACIRQFHVARARVHVSRTYLEHQTFWERFVTPESLRAEIISFDRGHKFETGAHTLAPLQPSLRVGVKRKGGKDYLRQPSRKPKKKKYNPAGVRIAQQSGLYS